MWVESKGIWEIFKNKFAKVGMKGYKSKDKRTPKYKNKPKWGTFLHMVWGVLHLVPWSHPTIKLRIFCKIFDQWRGKGLLIYMHVYITPKSIRLLYIFQSYHSPSINHIINLINSFFWMHILESKKHSW